MLSSLLWACEIPDLKRAETFVKKRSSKLGGKELQGEPMKERERERVLVGLLSTEDPGGGG